MKRQAAIHPGEYIKQSVLPKGISIKEAAAILGVGRPALSNLINGNASLSPEMALRLEKAFGAKKESLLQIQAAYEEFRIRDREKDIAVRSYAPSFLNITATQIAAWSDKIVARSLLPAFLRRLVHTTGVNLAKVDFPAFDNAQRHGWDGQVETDTATPWIPQGFSGWEFGCNQDPRAKADEDYQARVDTIPVEERRTITFVFVTPRNWSGKNKWEINKRAKKDWKDVRTFDASDLEQWLEQSVPTQSWMAETLGCDSAGILSLDECWDRWAMVTEPKLSKELFRGSITIHAKRLLTWLEQSAARPFIVAGDSVDEGLAFLAAALESIGTPSGRYYDRALALRTVEGLKKARTASSNFIAIISSPEVEHATAGLHNDQHTIIVRHLNAVDGDPDILLGLLDDHTFRTAIVDMGIPQTDVHRYSCESGQSATVLRRRLSVVPAIRFPSWAEDNAMARKLIPLTFAGVWNAEIKADREILAVLARESYETVEQSVAEMLRIEHTPVWAVGNCRGVVSKIDSLFAVHRLVTRQELEDFFFTAHYILSEKDPALDLPEDKRWLASLYGKTRDHSPLLREGICETLVLLAAHGNNLFQTRLGFDVQARVSRLISELLTPLDAATWASHQRDLPRYAEAAPEEFLDILEMDLRSDDPGIAALLAPARGGLFGSCPRTGLLWALELLAWKPERLLRVACILATLSEHKLDDNWANKPEGSLKSLFRSWMPQTSATIGERLAVLETLAARFPEIGWQLCIDQFGDDFRTGQYNCRPRWRNDAAGAGEPVTRGEDYQTRRKALDIAIDWPCHDEKTFGDLVERLHGIPHEAQEKVWKRIEDWATASSDEQRKATLRESIRRYAFTRRGRKRNLANNTRSTARAMYDLLEPKDEVVRHQWLFAKNWVEESLEELEDVNLDIHKREEKIERLRTDALKNIWNTCQYEGVLRLCESGDASHVIGWLLAGSVIEESLAEDFLYRLLSEPKQHSSAKIDDCISGFLRRLADGPRTELISRLVTRFAGEGGQMVRLLMCAPFRKPTWQVLNNLSDGLRAQYWTSVPPRWEHHEADELNELIDRLIEVGRPKTAFHVVERYSEQIQTQRLIRLLREIARSSLELDNYRVSPHDISDAFDALEKRSDVTRDELAQLEFIYIEVLRGSRHHMPNLERQLCESPNLFMQVLALTYKRSDDGEDPPEWGAANRDTTDSMVMRTHTLLNAAKRVPGTCDDGTIDLKKLRAWVGEVRGLCRTYAREVVGDHAIGNLLAKCPVGADHIWPCESVRQVLEETGSKDITDGMAIGVYNARGAMWRGEGGNQERDLAARYRTWSKELAFEYPFVAAFLEQIANRYDGEAQWHDADANLRKRLRH